MGFSTRHLHLAGHGGDGDGARLPQEVPHTLLALLVDLHIPAVRNPRPVAHIPHPAVRSLPPVVHSHRPAGRNPHPAGRNPHPAGRNPHPAGYHTLLHHSNKGFVPTVNRTHLTELIPLKFPQQFAQIVGQLTNLEASAFDVSCISALQT